MTVGLEALLREAVGAGSAIAAFNVYTLDQAAGVLDAATEARAAVILQVHPEGVGDGLLPLLHGLRAYADGSTVPVALHLDHCNDAAIAARALALGVDGVMADSSELAFDRNLEFVRGVVEEAARMGADVEGELGRLAGSEDGLSADQRAARLTDPRQAGGLRLTNWRGSARRLHRERPWRNTSGTVPGP